MVNEILAFEFAVFAFDEATELQRVMFVTCANIVGDQIIMSDLVSFLCMIPEVADVFDHLVIVIDQHIVYRDHTLFAVTSRRVFLQPIEPTTIQLIDIPIDLGQPTIETRLIRGPGKLLDGLFEESLGYDSPQPPISLPTVQGISPAHLSIDWRVEWEERAAIREYDGGLPRYRAEVLALQDVLDAMSEAGDRPLRNTG